MSRFRRYLNLKPYDSFESWNPDKEVARAAELLYGHIENLELYPGLMAETTKPAMPGSGVCPGQTTGRGILDDAVALVRGDRFLSYDFNSNTLTNWGTALLQETAGGSYGGVLPKLLFKALPGAWTGTSSYALLPFYTPEAAKGILKGNKALEKYETKKPASTLDVVSIKTVAGCKKIFDDPVTFRVLTNGFDNVKQQATTQSKVIHKIFFEEGFDKNVSNFFTTNVKRLIERNSLSFRKGRKSIDIVRDVINITPILWLAERFAIPLKTQEQPYGIISIYETFGAYLMIYIYQNFNVRPISEWKLREGATTGAASLRPIFETHLKTQSGIRESVVDWLAKGSAFEVGPHADRLYHGLIDSKLPIPDLVSDCIGTGAVVAGTLTHQASLLIDLFLSPGYEQYKARIIELATTTPVTPAIERELQGFVLEGIRHASIVPGLPRVAAKDVSFTDGADTVNIQAGNTILAATAKAALDPVAFPNPEKLDPHRPVEAYTLLAQQFPFNFSTKLVGPSLAATLREVFKLKNVRKAPGKLGQFTIVEHEVGGVPMKHYLDSSARESPIPTSLTLEYDA